MAEKELASICFFVAVNIIHDQRSFVMTFTYISQYSPAFSLYRRLLHLGIGHFDNASSLETDLFQAAIRIRITRVLDKNNAENGSH